MQKAASEGSKRVVVLLSGGIDSATALALARKQGRNVFALTFAYGQRHAAELEAARAIANSMDVRKHLVFPLNLARLGSFALTSHEEMLPRRRLEDIGDGEIPVTYVPGRNTIFLAIALAWSEVNDCDEIVFGANVVDYSGYPDCRPEFIRSFQRLSNVATKRAIEGKRTSIKAPLLYLSKADIIRLGLKLGVDFRLTLSCYSPSPEGAACGQCDACIIRKRAFLDVGLEDPAKYLR